MNEVRNETRPPQHLALADRKELSVTGVQEVVSCDEEIVVLRTVMGGLTVAGAKLHIDSFRRESGELKLMGNVKEMVYADVEPDRQGFFARLFR